MMACHPASKASRVCLRSGVEMMPFTLFCFLICRMSITSTSGNEAPSYLSESVTSPNFPLVAFQYVSTEGVADPKRVFAPCIDASTVAASRAL